MQRIKERGSYQPRAVLSMNGHAEFSHCTRSRCATLLKRMDLTARRTRPVQFEYTTMKNTLVVVTDLGCFKAFRLENHQPNRAPRLELVEEFNSADAHHKLVDKVSDLAGRFPRRTGAPNSAAAMSDGERHNIELELRKRLVRQMAQRLNALARGPEVERCLLAASREINHQFLEELEPQVRAKIEKSIAADLTKLERGEIMGHF